MGIPVIGCRCLVCSSTNVHNKRLRSSGLVDVGGKKILIDCGPDFRVQALKQGIDHIDGCLITHLHHDHTAGIDDLRSLTLGKETTLPCFASKETCDDLLIRFSYLFKSHSLRGASKIELKELSDERGSFTLQNIPIKYMTFEQADVLVFGFRFGSFAYLSDIKTFPNTIFHDLEGIETLVVSALRYAPSKLHFSVDEAVDFARKAGAKMTYLTHISHELDYEQTNAYLPKNIQLAFDGLKLHFRMEANPQLS